MKDCKNLKKLTDDELNGVVGGCGPEDGDGYCFMNQDTHEHEWVQRTTVHGNIPSGPEYCKWCGRERGFFDY